MNESELIEASKAFLFAADNLQRARIRLDNAIRQISMKTLPSLGDSVASLDLSVRARKTCNRLGVCTVSELVEKTAQDILGVRNAGMTTVNEIREKLRKSGYFLMGESDDQ